MTQARCQPAHKALVRRGFALEHATLAWNVAGIALLTVAAVSARSVGAGRSAVRDRFAATTSD